MRSLRPRLVRRARKVLVRQQAKFMSHLTETGQETEELFADVLRMFEWIREDLEDGINEELDVEVEKEQRKKDRER